MEIKEKIYYIMTKEEFKQYSELQEKFANDVLRVTGFLKEIDPDLKFVSEFQLNNGSVETHGWEYGMYQYSEEHYGYFDADMLTWTDDELEKYVAKKKEEAEKERLEKEQEQQKKKDEEEFKTWERLKKKFDC